MTAKDARWILTMIKDRDARTDAERDAIDMALTALSKQETSGDLISRQAAIDALHGYFDGMLETDTWSPCDVYGLIEILPSAQPDASDCWGCNCPKVERKTFSEMVHLHDEETHSCDCISRQMAIDLIERMKPYQLDGEDCQEIIHNLPSAQPEIIRCGQCKYAEVADKEDAQDGYTCQFHRGSIWFSGSYCSWAERRSEDGSD